MVLVVKMGKVPRAQNAKLCPKQLVLFRRKDWKKQNTERLTRRFALTWRASSAKQPERVVRRIT